MARAVKAQLDVVLADATSRSSNDEIEGAAPITVIATKSLVLQLNGYILVQVIVNSLPLVGTDRVPFALQAGQELVIRALEHGRACEATIRESITDE